MLAYVVIIPCDYLITTGAGTAVRADQAAADAVFERRSCGTGTKGPRVIGWALIATGRPRQFLLIRRLISHPDQLTYYLCWAPENRPATMTHFITIAGRRWPRKRSRPGRTRWAGTGARLAPGMPPAGTPRWPPGPSSATRPSATPCAATPASPPSQMTAPASPENGQDDDVDEADLLIPLGDAPVPAHGGQQCPPRIAPIRLSVAETARLTRLTAQALAGLITRARLAFALRWSPGAAATRPPPAGTTTATGSPPPPPDL